MPYKYNPPTRSKCLICEQLINSNTSQPIIDNHNGKASSANNFPFHNWYNFVLGYSPEFPQYMLEREKITPNDLVIDPFMGSGTTLITCKKVGIPSKGIDANDFMVDAARIKLFWDMNINALKKCNKKLLTSIQNVLAEYKWGQVSESKLIPIQQPLFAENDDLKDYTEFAKSNRAEMMVKKYISDKPFAKLKIIENEINNLVEEGSIKDFFNLALLSIIVPSSNVRYGPGFGIGKSRPDIDVVNLFSKKINRMITDLETVDCDSKSTLSDVFLGDARNLTQYIEPNSAKLIITSPPYPGDHEYTKHTRLELIFKSYATNLKEFRTIKKRMLRASTTNIYKDDNDKEPIEDMENIKNVTDLIQERLINDGATSGFEKLYTKLVWEYFGGMYKSMQQCFEVLQSGGKIALLVSDSHAFKMVHIQTAEILKEIGEMIGFINSEIILWQLKSSTSHKYYLRENILVLTKP